MDYIRVDFRGNPKSHRSFPKGANPLTEPNGEKDYFVPATLTDPPLDAKTQVREGPVYDVSNGMIIFTVRNKTALEIDNEKDKEADGILKQRNVKSIIAALNDGSFVPGSNYTNQQLKAILKNKL